MAKYVDAGVEVLVVSCTGGERGDVLNPKLKDDPAILRDLAQVRRDEMRAAQEILGVLHTWLGFVDSGLPEGDPLPRWAGLLDGGRGDALFTFYPPLCYFASAVLMKAFRRLAEGTIPAGSPGLNVDAVRAVSVRLYGLDGQMSFERAQVMGSMLRSLSPAQRSSLDAMAGHGMLDWPATPEPEDLRGLEREVKEAVQEGLGAADGECVGRLAALLQSLPLPDRQGADERPCLVHPGRI